MNAVDTTAVPAPAGTASVPMIGALRVLLLAEAVGGLVLAILLSMIAGRVAPDPDGGRSTEELIRFAAGGAFILAILAAFASRGARRRRPSAWTLAAILQVLAAVGIGIAVIVAEWHPLYLVGFAATAVVMLVLSTASVRRALGQA